MRGAEVQPVFETILPDKMLMSLFENAKFKRKLDALRLLRSKVVAGAIAYGGQQADVARLYLESGAARVEHLLVNEAVEVDPADELLHEFASRNMLHSGRPTLFRTLRRGSL